MVGADHVTLMLSWSTPDAEIEVGVPGASVVSASVVTLIPLMWV